MNKIINHSLIALGLFALLATFMGVLNATEIFEVRKSMLDTAERKLQTEKDPYKRFQILLRWIKIKEDFDQGQMLKGQNDSQSVFQTSKMEIIKRLQKEADLFRATPNVDASVLYRELGHRYLEIRKFEESQTYFFKVKNRTAEDEMGLADAMVGSSQILNSLASYDRAMLEPRLRQVALYKKAWANIQLNRFVEALSLFNQLLKEDSTAYASTVATVLKPGEKTANVIGGVKLREEAYRDRLRPYIETFASPRFTADYATDLFALAGRVYGQEPKQAKRIYLEFLRSLLSAFNDKGQVQRAEEVFPFIQKDSDDATQVLIMAAPIWLKAYRGLLDHGAMERVLLNLPAKKLDLKDGNAQNLQAELNNTALFYETVTAEPDQKVLAENLKPRRLLTLTYEKYFQNFPDSLEDSDPLRVNFSRLLLQDGQAVLCQAILAPRTKKDLQIEEVAGGIEAQCKLKELDQLYALTHSDLFYQKLEAALLKEKIYERKNLALTSEQTFDGLSRMLIGALQKNLMSQSLRAMMRKLIDEYPYAKTQPLFQELQVVLAELRFQDLVVDEKRDPAEKAAEFYSIFVSAPLGAPVAIKSLSNSILMEEKEDGLKRCDQFLQSYPQNFRAKSDVFRKCEALAEFYLYLKTEYRYLSFAEQELAEKELVKLGLIEIALDLPKGRKRLQSMGSELSKRALASWDGPGPLSREEIHPAYQNLAMQTEHFIFSLKPIKFKDITRAVPERMRDFNAIDKAWLKLFQSENMNGLTLAHILEKRAEMSVSFKDWMQKLPEPTDLNPVELADYQKKTLEVIKPWIDRADASAVECQTTAYTLSSEFRQRENSLCKEATLASTYQEHLAKWAPSRQWAKMSWPFGKKPEAQELYDRMVAGADALSNVQGASPASLLLARYFYLRALDLTDYKRDQAAVFLRLAKLRGKDAYWATALELDGNLIEALEWAKNRAKGNPFYERLYDRKIEAVRKGDQQPIMQNSVPLAQSGTKS